MVTSESSFIDNSRGQTVRTTFIISRVKKTGCDRELHLFIRGFFNSLVKSSFFKSGLNSFSQPHRLKNLCGLAVGDETENLSLGSAHWYLPYSSSRN